MPRPEADDMGLFEKAKSITDTDLRILVQKSDDPEEALRRHILSLEESRRQLEGSQGMMERQCQWLEASADRKLVLAEEWQRRAEASERQDRPDLASHAGERKEELMRSMGEDRRQLDALRPQLEEATRRLDETRDKVRKARAAREQIFGEGGAPPRA